MVKVTIGVPICKTIVEDLERCVKSILSQSFKDIELILVDDSETNTLPINTKKYIKRLCKENSNVKYINHKSNLGLVEARRNIALNANGQYLLYVDSDDMLYDDDVIQKMYNAAIENDADIVQGRSELFGSINNLKKERIDSLNKTFTSNYIGSYNGDITELLFEKKGFSWFIWGKLLKVSILLDVFLDIPNCYSIMLEDLIISFIFSTKANKYIGVSNIIYKYFIGHGMTSSKGKVSLKDWEKKCSAVSAFTILIYWINEHPFYEKYRKIIFQHGITTIKKQLELLENAINEDEQEAALEILKEYWGPQIVDIIQKKVQDLE